MTLYKQISNGLGGSYRVEMTPEEEAAQLAEWAQSAQQPVLYTWPLNSILRGLRRMGDLHEFLAEMSEGDKALFLSVGQLRSDNAELLEPLRRIGKTVAQLREHIDATGA